MSPKNDQCPAPFCAVHPIVEWTKLSVDKLWIGGAGGCRIDPFSPSLKIKKLWRAEWEKKVKYKTFSPQSITQKFSPLLTTINVGLSQLIQLEDLSYLNLELKVWFSAMSSSSQCRAVTTLQTSFKKCKSFPNFCFPVHVGITIREFLSWSCQMWYL